MGNVDIDTRGFKLDSYPNAARKSEEPEHINEIIEIKKGRLRVLERQEAFYGAACPPHIIMEIEQIKDEIDGLLKQQA